MIDIFNIWGLLLTLAIVSLFAWFLYPSVIRFIAAFIGSPGLVRFFTVVAVAVAIFGFWKLIFWIQSKPKPPDFVAVQQEFNRFEKDRQNYPLDNNWKTFSLSTDKGWVDSGFDFQPGDYFWVISYDSCLIQFKRFGSNAFSIKTIFRSCFQSSVNYQIAISLKVPLKYPPLYYNQDTNVFIKRWSYSKAESSKKVAMYFYIFLLFVSSFFVVFEIDYEIENYKKLRRDREYKRKLREVEGAIMMGSTEDTQKFFETGGQIKFPNSYNINTLRDFLSTYRDDASIVERFVSGFTARFKKTQDLKILSKVIEELGLARKYQNEFLELQKVILEQQRLEYESRRIPTEDDVKIAELKRDEAKAKAERAKYEAEQRKYRDEGIKSEKSEFEKLKPDIKEQAELAKLRMASAANKAAYASQLVQERREVLEKQYPNNPELVEKLTDEFARLLFEGL